MGKDRFDDRPGAGAILALLTVAVVSTLLVAAGGEAIKPQWRLIAVVVAGTAAVIAAVLVWRAQRRFARLLDEARAAPAVVVAAPVVRASVAAPATASNQREPKRSASTPIGQESRSGNRYTIARIAPTPAALAPSSSAYSENTMRAAVTPTKTRMLSTRIRLIAMPGSPHRWFAAIACHHGHWIPHRRRVLLLPATTTADTNARHRLAPQGCAPDRPVSVGKPWR